jgi:ATPase subunit of ABC transporter with duplicated ATPase domains
LRLSLSGVSKSFGAQLVLDNVSLAVGPRSRIGLVGPNGVGKTTLLRLLAGLEQPDRGSVTRAPETLLVGYMEQERDLRPDETLLAFLARRTGVAAAERELDRLTEALEADPGQAGPYSAALERFLALGGSDLTARASAVAADLGLGVDRGAARGAASRSGSSPPAPSAMTGRHAQRGRIESILDRPLRELSGGEAGRAALAAILLSRFDVYVLDEPTNDLDLDGLKRLEAFLAALPGGVVVVSHDRAFLDATVTRIAEIDPGSRRLREWAGGWSDYAAARDLELRRAYGEFERASERRRELADLVHRRQGEARGGAKMSYRRGTHALMTKVRQAQRALERADAPEKPFEPWQLRLELRAGERPGNVVIALEDAVVERGGFRLGPLDFEVRWRERVAVTGRNGSGKSTLIDALAGRLPLASGRKLAGPRTAIGLIEQARPIYRGDAQLLEEFIGRTGASEEDARTLLAKFGLSADHLRRPAASLSPGERTRAHLAELQLRRVNVLLLDEPTNHLDLEAVEQLEQALAGYDGSLVVVSHDRRFLEAVEPSRTVAL